MSTDRKLPSSRTQPVPAAADLAADVARLIDDARGAVATAVNSGLTLLYWRIGQRLQQELLKGERAEYGQEILATLSQVLSWSHFRDPYLLDFLGLKDSYQEKDLEAAILANIESFLMELGGGFSFVVRQKRISLDDDDFYLDLLFFH